MFPPSSPSSRAEEEAWREYVQYEQQRREAEELLSRLREELTPESFERTQGYLKLSEKKLKHSEEIREAEVNQVKASMDARFDHLKESFDARMQDFETRHTAAQAAADRHAFWLTCGSNFVFFVLGIIASAVLP